MSTLLLRAVLYQKAVNIRLVQREQRDMRTRGHDTQPEELVRQHESPRAQRRQ